MRFVQARLVPVLIGVALAAPVASAQSPAAPPARPAQETNQAPARVPLSIARGMVKAIADTRLVIDLGPAASGPGAGAERVRAGRSDADPAAGAVARPEGPESR